jgi:hypothetical protein
MAQLEAADALGRAILDREVIDPRAGRPAAHPLDHPTDGFLLAGQLRLHRAIRAIADPAADSELSSLALSPGAKKDALDETGYSDMAADERHYTVAMSGASSAFMPTTL